MLFLTLNLRLSTQNCSKTSKVLGALRTNLRQKRASAFRYLYSFAPKQVITIYQGKFICSILNNRHRNLVGFFAPPYSPPMHFKSTALSMNVSALSAKHSYFQYLELKMRFLVVLSMICVPCLASAIHTIIKLNIIMERPAVKPLRLSSSLILHMADSGQESQKLLMLIRKPHMSFENSLVFPGGVCEAEDEKFSTDFLEFSKITAIRETLQETGILLLPPHSKLANLEELKHHYAQRSFKELTRLILDAWEHDLKLLVPIARFITPQFPKLSRFDCYFFRLKEGVLRVNLGKDDSLYQLSIHTQESSKYYWASADEYLKMQWASQIFLPPPQYIILNYLKKMSILSIEPAVQCYIGQFKDEAFIMPGDKDYDHQIFTQIEQKSRTSQQIADSILKKKKNFKDNSLNRVYGVSPQKRKMKDEFKVVVKDCESSSTILALLAEPKITAKL